MPQLFWTFIVFFFQFQQKRHRSHRLHDDDYMFDDDMGSDGPNGVATKHWQSNTSGRQLQSASGKDQYSGVNMYEMTEPQSLSRPPPKPQMPPPPMGEVEIEGVTLIEDTTGGTAHSNYGYQQEPASRIEPTVRIIICLVLPYIL